MNKQFKFFLTSAAIAVALVGAVSCQKDFTGDIDDLNKKVTELTQKLNDLQTKIDNGEIVTNVEKISGGIKVTTNKNSYDIVNGKDGADGKDGANGKDGSVVTIGENGNWFIDGKDTGVAASGGKDGAPGKDGVDGKDGAPGKDGSVVTIGENGNWFIDGVDTNVHASGISAVWENDKLTIYGIEGYDGPYVLDLLVGLKGLAFVPERIYDGLGLITVFQLNVPKENKEYPFIKYATEKDWEKETEFFTTAPTVVTYRMDAENIDSEKYDWAFINRKVFTVEAKTKAAEDKTDLVHIEEGPVQNKSFVDFKIQLTKPVVQVALEQENDIVALRATDPANNDEPVVSDYAYIEKDINWGYRIIHKDEYEPTKKPYFYRIDYVDIDKELGPTDYNDGLGIVVNQKDANPATPVLVYNNEEGIDLLDYVETYGLQIKDLVSTKGIEPEYTFTFAGWDTAADKIMIGPNAKYETKDNDKTDQNKFLVFFGEKGSKVKVNKDFVSTLAPAIGRTPLIYVQSRYQGKLLADAFIKLEIVDKAEIRDPKGYKLFIKHGAEFDYNKILYNPPYKGEQFTAPLLDFNTEYANKYGEWELNVGWEEMNVEMFNALAMSYEQFQTNYLVSSENVKLVVVYDKGKLVEPGDFKEDAEKVIKFGELHKDYELVPFGEFDTYYGYTTEDPGIEKKCEDPGNWQQNTNIVSLSPNKKVKIGGPHFVYVVYEAVDDMINPHAVIKFVYNIRHEHKYTIDKWLLNPDYILGDQNELNPDEPEDYTLSKPYNKDLYGYGGVRIKGQNEDVATGHSIRSGLTEHFLKYMKDFEINEESTYKFEIMNYEVDDFDWEGFDTAELKLGERKVDPETNRAYIILEGGDLKKVIEQPIYVPYIFRASDEVLMESEDVLIQVTETCKSLEAVQEDYEPVHGFYYVVFQALNAKLKLYNVKLGTFKEINDYVLAPELVKGIFDEYDNQLFEYVDGAWTITEAAEAYGFENADDLKVTIEKKLKFPYEGNEEKTFGGNLYVINVDGEGETPVLAPTTSAPSVDAINWWNLGTDLQVDKKAQFDMTVMWGEHVLCTATGEIVVLATANSIHPIHSDAAGTIWAPVKYDKNDWFYAVAE